MLELLRGADLESVSRRHGVTAAVDDATLLAEIRTVLAESPFSGEGHRKVWARLRTLKGVRTASRRVLRVMRAADLLAPAWQPVPVAAHPHAGTIVTDLPNVMWGTDATASVTVREGPVTVFAPSITAPPSVSASTPRATVSSFEALEPLRQGVRVHFGGLAAAAAAGLALRHEHGSVYLSGDFQAEIAFLGMTSSPAFVRQPEGNGCIERFFRTLKSSSSGSGPSTPSRRSDRRPSRSRIRTTARG